MRWFQALFLTVAGGLVAASGCAGQEFASTTDPVGTGSGTSMTGADAGENMVITPPEPDCAPARRCASDKTKTQGQALDCGSAPDACGDTLQCGACPSGEKCQSGKCLKQAFCGNQTCDIGETCESCPGDCACAMGGKCVDAMCCIPDCNGKQCGDDGCGGVCGDPAGCGKGFICDMGACKQMASCGNRACEPMLME